MARGVAKSIDVRISEIDVKIAKKSKEIAALKVQRKELEYSKQSDLLAKVAEAAAKKGVSVEELLQAVAK